MMSHPYQSLPRSAFWRSGTAIDDAGILDGLYSPKFSISKDTCIATAGSCFAQHIGRALRQSDGKLLDAEPAVRGMAANVAARFGYGLYSARYGNIYTARQLRELLDEVQTGQPDPALVWQKNDSFYDALRPGVEPEGLASAADVMAHRRFHLTRIAQLLAQTDVFIFTLGLAETWVDRVTNRALPVCPGVIAGAFDASMHVLQQCTHAEVYADLTQIAGLLRSFQPNMKLILTVSPVPLTATATADHVVVATAGAKATLRAAAGEFTQDNADAAYFPALEIVTTPIGGGPWFEENGRDVSATGVDHVMRHFFAAHDLKMTKASPEQPKEIEDELNCEDVLLDVFAP